MARDLTIGDSSRTGMLRGVDVLTNTIKSTLGPRGGNVLISQPDSPPVFTRDGVTVARAIKLSEAVENIGVTLICEAAERTAQVAGDGTTTSTIIASAIFREGLKAIAEGANPNGLKRGIDKAVHHAVQEINRVSRPISGDDILRVGTVSANGDAVIGSLVANAINKIGRDGVITVEDSRSTLTSIDIVKGMRLDRGYLSRDFVTDLARNQAVLDDPFILIHEKKISALHELLPLLERVNAINKSLLIIAEDVEGDALATLIANKLRGTLNTVAIKAPAFGDRRKSILEDISVMTGATIINPEFGLRLENASLDHLGSAHRVTIDTGNTTIVGGTADQTELSRRIRTLRREISRAPSNYDRDNLNERLARLAGGVAVISVGAATEAELKEKKVRFEDAVHATRAALEEGVVAGGGVALLRAQQCLNELQLDDQDEIRGLEIVGRALEEPSRQIAQNAGCDGGVVVEQILAANKLNYGFNAATERFEDLFKGGVIDPVKVTRTALQNAASIAGMMITTEAAVTDVPKEPAPPQKARALERSRSRFRYIREPTWRPRYVQAEIFDVTSDTSIPVFDAFRLGTTYSIGVFIGPATDTAIVTDAVFPEKELPPSPDGHELTVVLTEPTLIQGTQVKTIFLPPEGKSNTCHFDLHIPDEYESSEIEARVIVLHQNRVIQTAILSGLIVEKESYVEGQIKLSREVIVRTNLDELGESYRQAFDAVLFFNHDSRGVARGYAIAGKKAEFFLEPKGIERTKEFFIKMVSEIVKKPSQYKQLRSPKTIKLLSSIARHGGYLYQKTIARRSTLANFAPGKRIQVIVAREGAQFPVEFFYDRRRPGKKGAGLCSGAEQALIDGACPKNCASNGKQDVCPLGFWGLSRIIERHAHDPNKIEKMKGKDFAVQVEPVKYRRQLNVLDYGLLAASNKVNRKDEVHISNIEKELLNVTRKNAARVDTWDGWTQQIQDHSPHLLILLPHTLEDEDAMQVLEISGNQRLAIDELTEAHIFGRKKAHPVVLLLGCGTDIPRIDYQSFPTDFRSLGAAIVISTTAVILGSHAAPVTIALLKKLAELRNAHDRSFGEIMLELRRGTLAEFPMTLCLTAYGDTDWLL